MRKGTETGERGVREGLSERATCEQKCKENKEAGHAGNWERGLQTVGTSCAEAQRQEGIETVWETTCGSFQGEHRV